MPKTLTTEERERLYIDAYLAELQRQSGRTVTDKARAARVARQAVREAIARRAGLLNGS